MVCSCVDDVALQQLPAFHDIISRILSLVLNQLIKILLSDGAKKWFDVSAGVNGYGDRIWTGRVHTHLQTTKERAIWAAS